MIDPGAGRLVPVAETSVRAAHLAELDARTFHDIARLRIDTFVVEQSCAYPELDGRDALPDTLHLWIEEAGRVVATLRMYPDESVGWWIGRVATASDRRGRGHGAALMRHAISLVDGPVRIYAQTRLAAWYAAFGFERCGEDFIEDGIDHTPMVLHRGRLAGGAVSGSRRGR